jgi:hypothetical protein
LVRRLAWVFGPDPCHLTLLQNLKRRFKFRLLALTQAAAVSLCLRSYELEGAALDLICDIYLDIIERCVSATLDEPSPDKQFTPLQSGEIIFRLVILPGARLGGFDSFPLINLDHVLGYLANVGY